VPGVVPPELLQEALKLIKYDHNKLWAFTLQLTFLVTNVGFCDSFELSKGFRPEELLAFRRPHVEGGWQITGVCSASASPHFLSLLITRLLLLLLADLLYKTAALPLAQSLIGKTHPGFGGQIALRCAPSVVFILLCRGGDDSHAPHVRAGFRASAAFPRATSLGSAPPRPLCTPRAGTRAGTSTVPAAHDQWAWAFANAHQPRLIQRTHTNTHTNTHTHTHQACTLRSAECRAVRCTISPSC
jgi:hypothetical protein